MNPPASAQSAFIERNSGSKTLQRLKNAIRYPHLIPLWLSWQSQGGSAKDPALRMFDMRFSGFPHFNACVGASHYRPGQDELSLFDAQVTGARTILEIDADGRPGAPIGRGITDPNILINAAILPWQD